MSFFYENSGHSGYTDHYILLKKKHVPKKFIQSTYRASEKLTGIPALQEDKKKNKKTGISKT